ncbi:MAG: acyl-CoA dehydrogenase [Sphingomonas sp.]
MDRQREGAFADWVGRSVESTDVAAAAPLRRLAATLDHEGRHWPRGVLPPLAHWLFHLPEAPQSALGADGHPAKGGFLPPISHPRRMWAGGRLRFLAPIPIGATMAKRTTILDIAEKTGAAGGMVFVTLRHVVAVDGADAIHEEQDLVYLPIAAPAPPRPVEHPRPESERRLSADATLLFRFSALTFNTHRIHYDIDYARDVELYPGLVVHGPLQAMLLVDHAMRDGIVPSSFSFRGRAPLYAGRGFAVARAGDELWVRDEAGVTTMTASMRP